MNKRSQLRWPVAALLAGSALGGTAFAQTVSNVPPPVHETVDENGIDVLSGHYVPFTPTARVGDDANGLSVSRSILGNSYTDDLTGYLQERTYRAFIVLGGSTVRFTENAGVYTEDTQNGDTLIRDANGYTYTSRDGTKYRFALYSASGQFGTVFGNPLQYVLFPSGKRLDYYYTTGQVTLPNPGDTGTRLQAVKSNTGYQVHFTYQHPDIQASGDEAAWSNALIVAAANESVDPCDVTLNICPYDHDSVMDYPNFSTGEVDSSSQNYVDADGNTVYFSLYALGGINKVRLPGSQADNISLDYNGFFNGSAAVSSISNQNGTTVYVYSTNGTVGTVVSTTTNGNKTYTVDLTNSLLLSFRDELGRETDYTYDTGHRLSQIKYPEGNYDTLAYDGRGNLLSTTRYPKSGSALAPIVTSAVYPASCDNPVTCNKPTSTTDARGKVTDYTYDPVHGGVLTITAPAPGTGTVRPQTRYTYSQLDADGAPSASGIYVVTRISSCMTLSSCSGAADEQVKTYTYGAGLLVASETIAAGNGSVTATRTMTYDKVGNLTSVDGPLAGSADTGYFKYDKNRQVTATIGPDPDGSGQLLPRVTRTTYSPLNHPAKVEVGTAAGPSDAQVAAMVVLQTVDSSFNAFGQKTADTASAGGTAFSVLQYNYDAFGRPDCVAQRMNPAVFGSLPDACSLGSESGFGPDRITRTVYDVAGQVTGVTTAYGTPAAYSESRGYTANGKLSTIADGKNNLTTYVYDGFDRLSQTFYPNLTTPGSSSATDYEQIGYDASGNVTTRRIRNGSSISYTYDNLNRLATEAMPSGTGNANPTYTYDLQGHVLGITNASTAYASGLTMTWDALGRQLSETSTFNSGVPIATTMRYDAAGRRTQLNWSDGFYITYNYDTINEMTSIVQNGGQVLASFTYDDLGRRTTRTVANGTSVTYGYDGMSRLTSLTLGGGASGATITLAGYNPAGEIGSRTISNDAYAWTGAANVNRPYTTNGLNQYTSVAGSAVGYDPKGNLTSSGGAAFSFGAENDLTTGAGGSFWHDPKHRLLFSTATSTRFAYDGPNMIGEYDASGNVLRRYVFGPADDEPIIWYEGGGLTSPRYLDPDERGSITRITDASGSAIAINTYDEFGIPGSTNQGRFQFTGQAWLPEIGLYNYKARIYSPTFGRFMQPDQIGYRDGLNWYNYAHDNPINAKDPSGNDDGSVVIIGSLIPYALSESISGFLNFFQVSGRQAAAKQPQNAIVVTARRSHVDCGSTLPNGMTVQYYVGTAIANINSTPDDPAGAGKLAAFIKTVNSRGLIDFKNNFKGQADAAFLAAAGNFAYGAIASGIGYSQGFAEFGAGAYAIKNGKGNPANPSFEDNSAAQNLPAGYATGGCSR